LKQQIECLRHLQEIDKRINMLVKKIEEIPIEINSIKQDLIASENNLKQAKDNLDNINKDRRKKERELETKEVILSKYKTQLLSVKTNKEYDAMQHEIASKKEEVSNLEEDIINLIDQTELDEELLKKKQGELKASQEDTHKKQEEKEQHLATIKNERDGMLDEKKTIESRIEPELLADYKKLYLNRSTIAVAEARNNACLGCNIRLMSQLFQEIIIGDKMIRCPNCSRILYYVRNEETNEKE